MFLPAQPGPAFDPNQYDPALDPEMQYSLFDVVFGLLCSCGGPLGVLLYTAFIIWMVVSCVRNDPERYLWIWIIIVVPLGALIYFLARWLPAADLKAPKFVHRWTRGREINRLQIAANQIGNAHQFVELGDALRETSRWSEAEAAYAKAVAKDKQNLQALWGASCVDFHHGKLAAARDKLAAVLEADPAYKFGDVSLLFGKVLHMLQETDSAREHLEKHTRRWRHPEGVFLAGDDLRRHRRTGNGPRSVERPHPGS